jgi:pimeloyl-ACP methyl ester carboxylesterase
MGHPIKVYNALFSDLPSGHIEIRSAAGVVVHAEIDLRQVQTIPTERIEQGIYQITLLAGNERHEEWLYYGRDARQLYDHYKVRAQPFLRDGGKGERNLSALLRRYEYLIAPGNIYETHPFWRYKAMVPILELESVLGNLEAGRDAFRDARGLHIRAYKSEVDGSVQHYMLFVPKTVRDGPTKIPLVVIVPWALSPNMEFLRSTHVARLGVAREIMRAAESHGQAVLWCHGRGLNYGNPIAARDIEDAIQSVKEDYAIDEDRVYLVGTCGGGREALALAERSPHRYAALGLVAPEIHRQQIGESDIPEKAVEAYAASWLERQSPARYLGNLTNIPIYIAHAEFDRHTPISTSQELIRLCKALGFEPVFSVIKGGTGAYFPEEPWDKMFEFLGSKVRVSAPREVTCVVSELKYGRCYWVQILEFGGGPLPGELRAGISANGVINVRTKNVARYRVMPSALAPSATRIMTNGAARCVKRLDQAGTEIAVGRESRDLLPDKNADVEGPLSDVFSRSFLVVAGSGGTSEERARASRVAAEFRSDWRRYYFADCPSKRDMEVTLREAVALNLILIGKANPQSTLGGISTLGVVRAHNCVRLKNRAFSGSELAWIAIAPSPFNPTKYVVECDAIRGAVPPIVRNWALYGWFDWAVWDVGDGGRIVGIGNFDAAWRHAIPVQ